MSQGTRTTVILPTLPGREGVFEQSLASLEETCPDGTEIIIPEDHPSIGEAWNAGMEDVDPATDYVYFAIDDAIMHPGWHEVAAQTADAGYIPAPRQEFIDGSLEMCGSMGFGALLPEAPDCTPCRNTGTIFIRHEWWSIVGPFAERHYSLDDLWCWKAAQHGITVVYRSGMRFTHLHERAATQHIRDQAQAHIRETLADMAALSPPRRLEQLRGPVAV